MEVRLSFRRIYSLNVLCCNPVGLGLPFDHIVNVVIEITDTDTTLTAINAEKKRAKLFD